MKRLEMIIDFADNFDLTQEECNIYSNELYSLKLLAEGLNHLNHIITFCEQKIHEQQVQSKSESLAEKMWYEYTKDTSRSCIWEYGNTPTIQGMNKPLIECVFQWYAVSACNFVRTVGSIKKEKDNQQLRPNDYVKSVIPEVKNFRDKVAAHSARIADSKKDNKAERVMSVQPKLGIDDGKLTICPMVLGLKDAKQESTSASMMSWSISEIHKRLTLRY